MRELKQIGHSLNGLADQAHDAGFQINNERMIDLIRQLDGKLLELRYLGGNEIELIDADEVLQLLDGYFVALTNAIPVTDLV